MLEQASIALSDLGHAARDLSDNAFIQMYGSAFFLHAGALDSGMSPLLRTLSGPDAVAHRWVSGDALHVFFVRPKVTNVFPDFISIGRSSNNDVVISHPSVSKFHAYIRHQREGLALYDAASANGTFAGEERVAVKGRGAPTLLVTGVTLRFGMVDVMFIDAESLRQLARTMLQHTPSQDAAGGALVANQR